MIMPSISYYDFDQLKLFFVDVYAAPEWSQSRLYFVMFKVSYQGRIQKIQKEGAESPTLPLEWKLHFNPIVWL